MTRTTRQAHGTVRAPHWTEEETDNQVCVDTRAFFQVEEWTADDLHVARVIYARNRLDKAHDIFGAAIRVNMTGRYYIPIGIRVIEKWPKASDGLWTAYSLFFLIACWRSPLLAPFLRRLRSPCSY